MLLHRRANRTAHSSCFVPLDAKVLTTNASLARVHHWRMVGLRHGLTSLSVIEAVDGSNETMMTSVLDTLGVGSTQQRALLSLTPDARRLVLIKIAMWASSQRLLARVATSDGVRGSPMVIIEDDALLTSGFCGAASRALKALPAGNAWDLLYLGHCAENYGRVRACNRTAGLGRLLFSEEFLSRGASPMCTHALAVTTRGAARLHDFLATWPAEYIRRVLASAKPGLELPGIHAGGKLRRSSIAQVPDMGPKRPLHIGHDERIARLVSSGHMEAYLVWPQVALQPWQGRSSNGIADMRLPPACVRQSASEVGASKRNSF